jgi:dienelactone hydrolase
MAGCAFPVEGGFSGRSLADGVDPKIAIVIIYNHGFEAATAGTYKPAIPPILRLAAQRNPDVTLFAQVRNTSRLDAIHHASYIESAIEFFHRRHGVPIGNIILAGQSCGGWGSLQAAAFTYPGVGGVLAFAPTCHGRLPHSTEVRLARSQQIAHLAQRLRVPGTIFLYEGDSYYNLSEWDGVDGRLAARAPHVRIERVSWSRVRELCSRCVTDSHGAVWDSKFVAAFFDAHLQPLIERVRADTGRRGAD